MKKQKIEIPIKEKEKKFDPFRLVSDKEFNTNLNAIIVYYQMSKGETKQRFISS